MEKLKVGHKFEVPVGFTVFKEFGGYSIASKGDSIFICGKTLFNLSEVPIMPATIMPITADRINELNENLEENSDLTGYAFEYEDGVVYFMVTYGVNDPRSSGTYVFDNIDDAISLQGAMVNFKAQSLEFKMGVL